MSSTKNNHLVFAILTQANKFPHDIHYWFDASTNIFGYWLNIRIRISVLLLLLLCKHKTFKNNIFETLRKCSRKLMRIKNVFGNRKYSDALHRVRVLLRILFLGNLRLKTRARIIFKGPQGSEQTRYIKIVIC